MTDSLNGSACLYMKAPQKLVSSFWGAVQSRERWRTLSSGDSQMGTTARRVRVAYFAVGIANSGPRAVSVGQRCMTLF